ncbi:response regulator [Candidatus Azambacteria bacterium]|nr:response regulator [Candidatus Azambacteria bacterium]
MDNKKVLIIEDDSFLSDMYKTKFSSDGFDVTMADDGETGIKLLKEGLRPAIILLDIVMPKLDGIETLTVIKKMDDVKNIPVIMLTNLGQKEEIDRAMALGAASYLIKANYTPSEVVKKVSDTLENKN